jgi:hypothetical protein
MEANCCCAPKPCPNCGYCPCCGRGYGFTPYQPGYPQPIWISTTGGYVPSTTTGVMPNPGFYPNVTIS